MVLFCCAFGRNSRSGEGFNFHKFPFNDKKLLNAWITAVSRKNFVPSKYSRLCSRHFDHDAYMKNPDLLRKMGLSTSYNRLKDDAVPTLYLRLASNSTRKERTSSKTASVKRAVAQVSKISHSFVNFLM